MTTSPTATRPNFLEIENLNNHMPTAEYNKLIFIERTGHTYQNKYQEVAEAILRQLQEWTSE